MNLYLISQQVNNSYDTYDSAVVVAASEDAAKLIHPSGGVNDEKHGRSSTWAAPEHVETEFLGIAHSDLTPRVIVSSFNAG